MVQEFHESRLEFIANRHLVLAHGDLVAADAFQFVDVHGKGFVATHEFGRGQLLEQSREGAVGEDGRIVEMDFDIISKGLDKEDSGR